MYKKERQRYRERGRERARASERESERAIRASLPPTGTASSLSRYA